MEPETLYFSSMTVQNVRCFKEAPQTLKLTETAGKPAMWNLILGDNGVGKTTLLRCLLGPVRYLKLNRSNISFSRILRRISPEQEAFEDSLTDSEQTRELHSGINCNLNAILELLGPIDNQQHHAKVQYTLTGRSNSEFELNFAVEVGINSGKFRESITDLSGKHSFMWGYGPERNLGASFPSSNMSPRQNALAEDLDDYIDVRTWLRELDYSASKPSEIQQVMIDRLEKVRSLLVSLLPDVADIRFTTPTKQAPQPDVEFKTPYGWVELKNVAYGYQSLVAWVVDFAYRLITQFPESENPFAEPAICLIDELDLHLHPSWQREVMGYLSKNFPNTQFIATVHSPLVVQAAPEMNANVAVLRRVKGEPFDHVEIDNDPEIIRSWRLDQLLSSDLFATTKGLISPRNPEVQQKIDERRQILSKTKLTKADKQRLGEITDAIDMVPVSETSEAAKIQELLAESYRLLSKEQGKG